MINIFTDYLVRALANIFISDFMMILSSLFNARMEFFVLFKGPSSVRCHFQFSCEQAVFMNDLKMKLPNITL